MNEYDEFQNKLKAREFCVGWRQEGSQLKHYYSALFDSWHEANAISVGSVKPGWIPFVSELKAIAEFSAEPESETT